jgi:hypothetical protein
MQKICITIQVSTGRVELILLKIDLFTFLMSVYSVYTNFETVSKASSFTADKFEENAGERTTFVFF